MFGKHFRRVCGHEDDPLAGPVGQDLLGELHSIGLRHDHVQQHQIDGLLRDPEDIKGFLRPVGLEHAKAELPQHAGGDASGDALIVDDEGGDVGWRNLTIHEPDLDSCMEPAKVNDSRGKGV
jgi:hypothetical protein